MRCEPTEEQAEAIKRKIINAGIDGSNLIDPIPAALMRLRDDQIQSAEEHDNLSIEAIREAEEWSRLLGAYQDQKRAEGRPRPGGWVSEGVPS